LVRKSEHLDSYDAKTMRFIVIDCLSEVQGLRIGPMKLRTGDQGEDRSRFVDAPDIVGNWLDLGRSVRRDLVR
jgi:hypothetical protein